MKWSITGAVVGVIAVLAIFARSRVRRQRVEARKLVATELNQLELTRYDEDGRKLEVSRADHAVQLEGESELLLGGLTWSARMRKACDGNSRPHEAYPKREMTRWFYPVALP